MKHTALFPFVVLVFSMYWVSAQDAFSIEEALETPKEVTKLDLSGKGLKTLPESIGKLKNLEALDLSPERIIQYGPESLIPVKGNMIKTLPASIGKLRSLKKINLQATDLRDLPESFSNLQNLTHVDLSYNPRLDPASVIEALSGMPMLIYINIAGCRFSSGQVEALRKGCPEAQIIVEMELTRRR